MGKSIRYCDIHSKFICGKMIVTEKIHGSNFGIGYIDGSLWLQSRNQTLPRDSKNFNMNNIVERLIEIVEPIRDKINRNFLIYGEIFGHMKKSEIEYRDPESEKVFGSKTTFFRAFDLYDADEKIFWKYSDAVEIFKGVGLPHVPILDVTYEKVGDLYSRVESFKSAYSDDCVEGFVLKEDEARPASKRNIFKIKREKFNDKRNGPEKFKIKNYVTDNKYSSAYSKIGDDLEKIKEEMIADTLKDIVSVFEKEVKVEVEKYLAKKFKNRKLKR